MKVTRTYGLVKLSFRPSKFSICDFRKYVSFNKHLASNDLFKKLKSKLELLTSFGNSAHAPFLSNCNVSFAAYIHQGTRSIIIVY